MGHILMKNSPRVQMETLPIIAHKISAAPKFIILVMCRSFSQKRVWYRGLRTRLKADELEHDAKRHIYPFPFQTIQSGFLHKATSDTIVKMYNQIAWRNS